MTRARSSTRSAAKERSPVEELEATLAAIAASDLNAFSFLDPERAMAAARDADVMAPFGGVPVGVKELEPVEGWPATEASLVFRDRVATTTSPVVQRLFDARRRRPGRAHDRERVRRSQHRRDEAQRRHAQSVAARAHARWVVGRERGGGRGRARDARDRR